MKYVEQIPLSQHNAEQFVAWLVKMEQPLEDFIFREWISNQTGFRWFSVERGAAGSKTRPLVSRSYQPQPGESLEAFQSAVAVAVMQAL